MPMRCEAVIIQHYICQFALRILSLYLDAVPRRYSKFLRIGWSIFGASGVGIYNAIVSYFIQLREFTRRAEQLREKSGDALPESHGLEYGFGAHEYPTSGVFEVEPRSCPGFIFRRSILLGSTDMSCSEFRSFMEHLSNKYHGDTYNLISKNCNHFTDEVCQHLTGKPIPGWVNRLARLGSFCNCLLPESIQATSVTHLPDLEMYSEDGGGDSGASSATGESDDEGVGHHLLTTPNSDVAFLKDKQVRLAKEIL